MQPTPDKVALRELAIFLAASLTLLASVFGDALIGRSLLAPVDLAPALWAKYRFVDPDSNGVPRNHNLSDQLAYDLPLQHLMHDAWRRGEIPWWNPYSFGGRPLLADAHCNGSDPIRIGVYLATPDFVTAYNWTRGLHWIWASLGLYLLLRRAGNPPWLAGLLALAGEVAGWKTQLFGHPWVEGALCWYPWLWWIWSGSYAKRRAPQILGGSLCVAAILLAGNLQSHAFLPLFALAVAWGKAGRSWRAWKVEIQMVGAPLMLGSLLAAPIILAELELFLRNTRVFGDGVTLFPLWHIPFAFSAFHPWLFGTPRTGAYMTLGVGAFGFALWVGSAILPLALIGLRRSGLAEFRRTAVALVIGYLIIVASPLYPYLYARYSGIPVMGLLVLAGNGVQSLIGGWQPARWLKLSLAGAALIAATFGDIFGQLVFPHLRDAYSARLQSRANSDGYGGRSALLRAAQANAVPSELSLRNPEVGVAIAALLAAVVAMTSRRHATASICGTVLVMNLFAPAIHARRFLPRSPMEPWRRLVSSSAEQRALIQRANEVSQPGLRLEEAISPEKSQRDGSAGFFPYEIASLYRLHVVHGYAALTPWNAWWHAGKGAANADLTLWEDGRLTETPRRFQVEGTALPPRILAESLTSIEIAMPSPSGARLIWRDTPFPGWRAANADTGQSLAISPDAFFSRIEVPDGAKTIRLIYRPTHWQVGVFLAAVGGIILFYVTMNGIVYRRIR